MIGKKEKKRKKKRKTNLMYINKKPNRVKKI
jgi:hypothetical protein